MADINHYARPLYNGFLVFETGTDQHAELSKEAEQIGYQGIRTTQDLNGYDRFLWMQR